MSIINYESPLVTVTKVNGDYQATVQADSGYLISSIESTTQTPSEGAEWTQLEPHGEGEEMGILNSGKYETIRPILSVNDSNINYRIKTTPISHVVNLHRNHYNDDPTIIQKYIDHSARQLNRGDITVGGHTYTFMQDNAVIQFPSQQWEFPSGFNTFEGWNTEPDGTGEYITDCLGIINDTDLYAIYTLHLNPPSVRYDPTEYNPDTGRGKAIEVRTNNGDMFVDLFVSCNFDNYGPIDVTYYDVHEDPTINPPANPTADSHGDPITHIVLPVGYFLADSDKVVMKCKNGDHQSEESEVYFRDMNINWQP